MHEGIKAIKINKLQQLTTRFESIRMSDDESFDEFYAKLNDVVNSTYNLGEIYDQPCQVLNTQVLCIQNPNLYCWQTMIKTMYLSYFISAQSWFFVVKLECNTKLFKKQIQYISIDRNLGLINRKSYLMFF